MTLVLTGWDDGYISASYNFGSSSVTLPTTSSITSSAVNVQFSSTNSLFTSNAAMADDRVLFHNGHLFIFNPDTSKLNIIHPESNGTLTLVGTQSLSISPVFLIASGSYLYGMNYGGELITINVSNLSHPIIMSVSSSQFPSESFMWYWPVIHNNCLYASSHYNGGGGVGSVLVYNLTSPAAPKYQTRWKYPSGSWGGGALSVKDNYLYVNDYFSMYSRADGKEVFHVVDISNTSSISTVATKQLSQTGLDPAPFESWGNFIDGNYLFVTDDAFVQKYDISNPSNPTYVTESYYGTIGVDVNAYTNISGTAFLGMMEGSSLVTINTNTMSGSVLLLSGSGGNYATTIAVNQADRHIYFVFDGILNVFHY
jgi:hypothetical protein